MIENRFISIIIIMIFAAVILAGCEAASPAGYNARIDQEHAMEIMVGNEHAVILDVRTSQEFNAGHIPNAISLPVDEIQDAAALMLPDKDEVILVYCQSGARSAKAAVMLVDMGYRNVFNFGGIMDWTGEIKIP